MPAASERAATDAAGAAGAAEAAGAADDRLASLLLVSQLAAIAAVVGSIVTSLSSAIYPKPAPTSTPPAASLQAHVRLFAAVATLHSANGQGLALRGQELQYIMYEVVQLLPSYRSVGTALHTAEIVESAMQLLELMSKYASKPDVCHAALWLGCSISHQPSDIEGLCLRLSHYISRADGATPQSTSDTQYWQCRGHRMDQNLLKAQRSRPK